MVSHKQILMKSLAVLLIVVAVLAASPFSPRMAYAGGVTIVVHPGVPENNLTLAELRRIFRGDRQYWSSKLPITLLFPNMSTLESKTFLNIIHNMNEEQLNRFWKAKVYRAEITVPPKLVFSDKELFDTLMSIPGSIAFVNTSTIPNGVKVLTIDGRKPEDSGYPLH